MDTSFGYSAYKGHDLNIAMRTSSGDEIEFDFANHQSTSFTQQKNDSGTKTSLTFSSMQSFQFNMTTNGIDAQDKKEIDAFMKIAQPYIDDFLAELDADAPRTPVTQLAHTISDLFAPMKEKNNDTKNYVKTNLVEAFDKGMQKLHTPEKIDMQEALDKIFEEAKKLLEKTLEQFDKLNKELYA